MKKYKVLVLMFIIVLCFSGCSIFEGFTLSESGIENFKTVEGEVELNLYLLPSEDFIERFDTIDVSYNARQRYKTKLSILGIETVLIVATYDDSVYAQAKEYCLSEMMLYSEIIIDYNGYRFIENNELAIGQSNRISRFPRWTNMFAYNDDKCELVFMGFYDDNYSYDDADAVCENWGDFLKEHFSEDYDFK